MYDTKSPHAGMPVACVREAEGDRYGEAEAAKTISTSDNDGVGSNSSEVREQQQRTRQGVTDG